MAIESSFYKKLEAGLKALTQNDLLEVCLDKDNYIPPIIFNKSSSIRIRFIPVFQNFEVCKIITEPYEQDDYEFTTASSVNQVLSILFGIE